MARHRLVRAPPNERCKATWKREFELLWREAGPPNHHDDEVVLDQQVVNKEREKEEEEGEEKEGGGRGEWPTLQYSIGVPRSQVLHGCLAHKCYMVTSHIKFKR